MAGDTLSAASFYGTPYGRVACRLLREQLLQLWPDLKGQTVLGLGYTAPYLRVWRGQATRCVAAAPAQMGVARWPITGANLACAVEETALPFHGLEFDRVLLVHGLEASENSRALLREVWRVLKDDGRLIVVAPNRVGLWAHLERTPFGHGRPFSPGQLERLLAGNLFRVERRGVALYVPPTTLRLVLRTAPIWERTGRWLVPHLGGVTITESVKDAYAGVPFKPARQRRVVLSKAACVRLSSVRFCAWWARWGSNPRPQD